MRIYVTLLLMLAAALPAFSASLTQWAIHSPGEVQKALADKGYNPGPVDGHWGKRSISALKAFQRASGLKPTGVFDETSNDALFPTTKETQSVIKAEPQVAKPVVNAETQDEKPVVTDSHPAVKEQPTVQKPMLANEEKKDAAAREPVTAAASKIQVIVEKPQALPVERELKPVDIAKREPVLPSNEHSSLPPSWIAYGALGAFATVVLAFALRQRRKPGGRSEPLFDGQLLDEPLAASASAFSTSVVSPADAEDKGLGREVAQTALANSASATHDVAISDARATNEPEPQPRTSPTIAAARPAVDLGAELKTAESNLPDAATGYEVPVDAAKPEAFIATQELAPMGDEGSNKVMEAQPPSHVSDKILAAIHVRAAELAEKSVTGGTQAPTSSPPPDFRVSLADHSRAVAEFVQAKSDRIAGAGEASANEEKDHLTADESSRSDEDNIVRPFFGTARRSDGSGPLSLVPGGRNAAALPRGNNDIWVPPGTSVAVGGISFDGGLVYVGSYLPKKGAPHENENCLIDPKLKVSPRGDSRGQTMGYWPAYSGITPEARRSYLDWLASDRADPDAYIGYVFLYFYGLERRLMLEGDRGDHALVVQEVERLMGVYGGNGSFNRYARELLSAFGLKAGPQAEGYIPDADDGGYDVPMPIKLALGVRVRDGKPFEPELLMKFALSHPETKVRTPARRAPELLKQMFADELGSRHPQGFMIKAGRFKKLQATYRACSGSFTIDVAASDGSIPDITDRAEPLTTARTIFEACSDRLDEYSRALGRAPNMQPTLAIAAKLPGALRNRVAATLPGNPLAAIRALAGDARPVCLGELLAVASIEPGNAIGKTKLREMSQLLGSFGIGNTADPAYALRLTTAQDHVVLFPLRNQEAVNAVASPAYRAAQLSMMIGMLVGHADGHFDDTERRALQRQIDQNRELSDDEKTRLVVEMSVAERNPAGLEEWSKRLKDLPEAARGMVGAELVAVAAADGNLHAAEIKKLETLFKRMGLDPESLYTLLHETGTRPKDHDDVPLIIPAAHGPNSIPIPSPPQRPASTINFARLAAIRSETIATAIILEGILGEDEAPSEPAVPEPELPSDGGPFEGLERRYSVLVTELSSLPEWSRADFDTLVKNAGLMPGAAMNAINEWSFDRFDEPLIEGDDPLTVNAYLLPPDLQSIPSIAERIAT